jgi:hypothetical protein
MGPFHEIVSEFNRPLASADISNIRASNASGSLPAPRIETATLDAILSIKIFDLPDGATIEFALTIDGTNVSSHVLQFLVGDLNRTKWVNAVDIVATKAIRGSPVNIGNFVYDVNLTGAIDDADVSLIKSRSGKTLVP